MGNEHIRDFPLLFVYVRTEIPRCYVPLGSADRPSDRLADLVLLRRPLPSVRLSVLVRLPAPPLLLADAQLPPTESRSDDKIQDCTSRVRDLESIPFCLALHLRSGAC